MTGHVPLRSNLAKRRVVGGGVGSEEGHLIEDVQRFESKLQGGALFDPGVVEQGGIPKIVCVGSNSAKSGREGADITAELLGVVAVEDAGVDPPINRPLSFGERYVVHVAEQDHISEGERWPALIRVDGR